MRHVFLLIVMVALVALVAVSHGQGAQPKGDMDCNTDVNAVDALRILRHVAGLDPNLPPGCDPIGSAGTPTPTPTPTPAPTLTPTRFDDPAPDGCQPGDCSLREALISASNNPGPDSITLPAGTYTLSIPGAGEGAGATGDLGVNDALTLTGAGAATTVIDGGGIDRVFFVSTTGNLTLSNVTVQGGQTAAVGGGILNWGTLTVRDSVFRMNTAHVGGGIGSRLGGRLTVERTTITENTGDGGGLFVADPGSHATIKNSTISGNTGILYSGGVHVQSEADVTLTNVTISGNSAPWPTAMTVTGSATVTLTNVTIAENISTSAPGTGGAVANWANLSLQNTIVQDAESDCYGSGTFQSLGHNIDADGTCHLTGPGDQPSTDPMLGPLADNGGPTETLALLAGSPGINAGDDAACPLTDQRGFGRVDVCDIGAFEFGGAAASVKQGDVNCDDEVAAVDAPFVLRKVAGLTVTLPPGRDPIGQGAPTKGDMDCNTTVDAVDALRILRHVAGLDPNLPPGCDPIGGAGTPTPTPPPRSGMIAFISHRDGNDEIYVMNADGTGQTRLTNNPAQDDSPVWSPDGSKIAFRSTRDGNAEIYVMNADGTGQTNLTNNTGWDTSPVWSPDGSKIAFHSDPDGNWEIYVMNADGTGQTNLTNNAATDADPVWSPDGTKIAFLSYRDGSWEIYVMNADGSGQTRLTNNAATDEWPVWSPDGTKIALRSYRDGNYEIYVMNADGTDQTRLTNNDADDDSPDWSPDGSKIALHSYRDGNYEIYVMNADGSGQTNLTNNAAGDYNPVWSPDGSKIAFVSDRDGNIDIYVMNADGSGQTRLTNNAADDLHPVWSP